MSAPHPRPFTRITSGALRPGDVLLSCGAEPLSQLIRKVAGGLYSHAALWDGRKVVEATASGVKRRTLAQDKKVQWYLDAYRWLPKPPNGHQLGDRDYPSRPVTTEADSIVRGGVGFAYDELLMAAFVVAVSERPSNPLLRAAARVGLAKLGAWIHARTQSGKRTMLCTEVVCTSFWDAVPNPRFAINIWIDGQRANRLIQAGARSAPRRGAIAAGPFAQRSASDYEQLQRECATLFLKAIGPAKRKQLAAVARTRARAVAAGTIPAPAGGDLVPLGCVTPRDLETSPNLRFVGRLSERPTPVMPDTPLGALVRLLGMP